MTESKPEAHPHHFNVGFLGPFEITQQTLAPFFVSTALPFFLDLCFLLI